MLGLPDNPHETNYILIGVKYSLVVFLEQEGIDLVAINPRRLIATKSRGFKFSHFYSSKKSCMKLKKVVDVKWLAEIENY